MSDITPGDTVAQLNDLRLRIVQARDLAAEGKHTEAAACEPSPEELRDALIAPRFDREQKGKAKVAKKEKEAKFQSMDLNDLFNKPVGG